MHILTCAYNYKICIAGGENIKKLLGSLSLSPENEAKLQGDSDIDVGVAKTMQVRNR